MSPLKAFRPAGYSAVCAPHGPIDSVSSPLRRQRRAVGCFAPRTSLPLSYLLNFKTDVEYLTDGRNVQQILLT